MDEIKVTKVGRMWVYNKHTRTASRRDLVLKRSSVESWYQEVGSHTGIDSFYVSYDKQCLIKRVQKSIEDKLKAARQAVDDLEKELHAISNG